MPEPRIINCSGFASMQTFKPLWKAPLAAFFDVAAAWELSEREQTDLLDVTLDKLQTWRSAPEIELPWETTTRIDYILAIQRALSIRFDSVDRRNDWLRQRSALSASDKSPLEIMSGAGLAGLQNILTFLQAELQGW